MTGDATASAGAGEVRRFEGLDVLVQGAGIRRDVAVEVRPAGVQLGEVRLPAREIWWTSRRAGLLMLFARDRTLAVKGGRGVLDELARRVEARRVEAGTRGRLPEELTAEVVVCTAGTAVVGRVGGRKTSGLRVGVFTRRGVHLLAGDGDLRLGWPADEARVVEDPGDGSGGRALVLRKGEDVLRLLYLFPEETDAVLRVARSEPAGEPLASGIRRVELPEPDPDGDGEPEEGPREDAAPGDPASEDIASRDAPADGGADPSGRAAEKEAREAPAAGAGSGPPPEAETPGDEGPSVDEDDDREAGEELEMFARREVAGPVRPRLPEFRLSVEVLQAGAEDAAGRFSDRQVERADLAPHFLETHFLELGETALGPLLLRKSAAATARTLERALEAMDASELQDDTDAAASNAADRMIEVYGRRLDRLVAEKRAPSAVEDEHELSVEEREDLRLRIHAPFEKLAPLFRDLEERQEELRRRVRALETGPPDADDRAVREAAEAWRRALGRVDRGFVDAWDEVVEEIAGIWERRLLPSLAEVGSMPRRRMPEWMLLALLAVATVLAAAGIMIFLVG